MYRIQWGNLNGTQNLEELEVGWWGSVKIDVRLLVKVGNDSSGSGYGPMSVPMNTVKLWFHKILKTFDYLSDYVFLRRILFH
jgi:hypothetical protein